MRLSLILSNDWEVFGDGSGDFFELQDRPLRELRKVCADFDAKLTIFAEIGQQLFGYRRLGATDPAATRVAKAWEVALAEAVREGHDVQCHLHPQWLDAHYEGGRWHTNFTNYSISNVPFEQLRSTLTEAKTYLEAILQPVNSDYRCRCFRAGGFCIQPSNIPLRAIREVGMEADSSVVPGLFEDATLDHRDAPEPLSPWRISNEVIQPDPAGKLWELPVYARPAWDSAVIRKLLAPGWMLRRMAGGPIPPEDIAWQKRRNSHLLRLYPLKGRAEAQVKNRLGLMAKKILRKTVLPLDYDQMPPTLFLRFLRQALEDGARLGTPSESIPIIALGHTKGMPDAHNFNRILTLAKKELGEQLEFSTIAEALDKMPASLPSS